MREYHARPPLTERWFPGQVLAGSEPLLELGQKGWHVCLSLLDVSEAVELLPKPLPSTLGFSVHRVTDPKELLEKPKEMMLPSLLSHELQKSKETEPPSP